MKKDNWNKKVAPLFALAILVMAQLKRKYSTFFFLSGEGIYFCDFVEFD